METTNSNGALEKCYTPNEIAEQWAFHPSTIRRLFRFEPGVLRIGSTKRGDRKASYVTLRIPESVLRRVKYRNENRRAGTFDEKGL